MSRRFPVPEWRGNSFRKERLRFCFRGLKRRMSRPYF
jgi:hypothetical protein